MRTITHSNGKMVEFVRPVLLHTRNEMNNVENIKEVMGSDQVIGEGIK